MALHSHVRIYVHLVWGTYKHERILVPEIGVKLFHHLVERANELQVTIEKMNIQPEHVHILSILPADKPISEIPKNLKGESSHWLNQQGFYRTHFEWQRGYGAFSVSASQVDTVKHYIENQDEHHQHKTFSEEYQEWAQKYGVWHDDDEI